MEHRALGQTDLVVSSLGMGGVTFGREADEGTSFRIMDLACESGITLFDTAMGYGDGASELVIGKWLKHRGTRSDIVLATKVHGTLTRDTIVRSCEDSLTRLGTDVIDLYQLHHWDDETPLEETLQALDELTEAGKVRYLGVSNCAAWQLCKALWTQGVKGFARFESMQPNYSLAARDTEKEIIPLCTDQQVGVISYSPLGAGFLTGKYRKGGPVPPGTRFALIPGHQQIFFSDRNFDMVETLRSFADSLAQSMVHLALAWVFRQPGITSVLIGARSPEHLRQALDADKLTLDDATLATLGNL